MSVLSSFVSHTLSSRILLEGDEEHDVLHPRLAELKAFLDGGVTSEGTRFTPWETGDLKWNSRKGGMSGNFATHDQCLWCTVPRSKLSSLDRFAARTVESNRVLAHFPPVGLDGVAVFPFACGVCNKTFHSQESVEKEILSPAQLQIFPTLHKGVMWHQAPCTSTPIEKIVPCVLHMRLRFCCTLWDWCIAPSVLVKRADVAAKVMKMLQTDGVNTNRLRKLNDFSDVKAVKNASFDGQGCDKVLARFDEYLEASGSRFRELGFVNPYILYFTLLC